MKLFILTTIISFLACKTTFGKATFTNDTLYVFFKNDNKHHNQIKPNVDSLSFYVYAFGNQPKDWLDSAGFFAMLVGVEKKTEVVCNVCAFKEICKRK